MPRIFLTLIVLLLLVEYSFTQSQSTTGNIEGRIVYAAGAFVTGVIITATNQETGFAKSVLSDSEGSYIFVLLPLGNYILTYRYGAWLCPFPIRDRTAYIGRKRSPMRSNCRWPAGIVDVHATFDVVETRSAISSTIDERVRG